jgi:predicted component of type VI protein secretion system
LTSASESAIRRAVQRVDPQALDTALTQWLRSHELPGPQRTFAADGKSVRTVAKINGLG